MKKRTLIASTALLLVAIMCLATASYAWFTSGADAKAQGLTINATAGSALLIKGDDDSAFGKVGTTTLSQTTMVPATSADGTDASFRQLDLTKAEVLSAGNYEATKIGGGAIAASDLTATLSGDYKATVHYQLKNSGTDAMAVAANVALGQSGTIWNSVRVAILTSTDGTNYTSQGVWALNPSATAVGATLAAPTYKSNNAQCYASLAGGDVIDVKLVVWFEGQDTNCYTDAIDTTASAVTVTFTGA